jgi:sec-independent protein translocase protein TatB
MFGIGMPEMLLILAIALIVIGPKKLPDLAKSLGKAMGEFKKAAQELKNSFDIDDEIDGMKQGLKNIDKDIGPESPLNEPDKSPNPREVNPVEPQKTAPLMTKDNDHE